MNFTKEDVARKILEHVDYYLHFAEVGSDAKGMISVILYMIAIPLAFVNQLFSDAIYVFVALSWLVPDRRIEQLFDEISGQEEG